MKKIFTLFICLIGIATANLMAQNLIPNGDFEIAKSQSGHTNEPDGWRFNKLTSIDLKGAHFNRPGSEGEKVLRIWSSGNKYSYMSTVMMGADNVIELEEGETYKLSFFAKSAGNDKIQVLMDYYMAGDKMPEEIGEAKLTAEWQEFTFEVPAMTPSAGLRLYFPTDNDYIFLDDVSLTLIKESSEDIVEIDGIFYYMDVENLTATVVPELEDAPYFNTAPSGKIIIPSIVEDAEGTEYTVVGIDDNAFAECKELTEVVLPNTVTRIGNSAFDNSGIQTIIIPETVTEMGQWIFMNCQNLTNITFPNNIAQLPDGICWNCSSLKEIEIPASVVGLGYDVFNSCTNLKKIICNAIVPPTIIFQTNGGAFFKVDREKAELVVPAGSEKAYKEAEEWKSFGTIVTAISNTNANKPQIEITNNKLSIGKGYYQVYTIQGQLLFKGISNGKTLKLSQGAYIISLNGNTQKVVL